MCSKRPVGYYAPSSSVPAITNPPPTAPSAVRIMTNSPPTRVLSPRNRTGRANILHLLRTNSIKFSSKKFYLFGHRRAFPATRTKPASSFKQSVATCAGSGLTTPLSHAKVGSVLNVTFVGFVFA